jgi:hypothetical protein
MDGIRLLKVKDGVASYFCRENAMVDRVPVIKYKIDKKNSFNPTIVIRREPYYEDTFQIDDIMEPEDHLAYMEFIDGSADYYLEYEHAGMPFRYPVNFDKMPKSPDELRSYITKTDLILQRLSSV